MFVKCQLRTTFGFTMLWGYLFFSQFLPQWYGNLPEETQWLFLRTREYPWKGLSWLTFSCAFVFPFIVLISEDVKRVGKTVVPVTLIILLGVWLERYVTVMPQLSPTAIPLVTAASGSGVMELGIFLGFMGIYVLSVLGFWSRYPMVPVAHPLTHGSDKW